MVAPTGPAFNEKVGKWTAGEMQHAVEHWRRQFRGDARVKNDKDITEADIAAHNLILWGDPSSNAVLAKIADRLPIRWTKDGVQVRRQDVSSGHHVPVLIYPNPLNPKRYVVLNSGFTYPRVRLSEQRAASSQAARLRPDRHFHAGLIQVPGRNHHCRLLRRKLAITPRRPGMKRSVLCRQPSPSSLRYFILLPSRLCSLNARPASRWANARARGRCRAARAACTRRCTSAGCRSCSSPTRGFRWGRRADWSRPRRCPCR